MLFSPMYLRIWSSYTATPVMYDYLSWLLLLMLIGMQHLYKNKLQNFSQKRGLTLPMYTCERDGPPHASRFRCKVEIDGKTYESLEFHGTLKDAENAVAKVALMSLCQDGAQEASILI